MPARSTSREVAGDLAILEDRDRSGWERCQIERAARGSGGGNFVLPMPVSGLRTCCDRRPGCAE